MNSKQFLLLLSFSLLLTACEKDTPPIKQQQVIKKYEKDTLLEGMVNGNNAPIKTGVVHVTTALGKTITKTNLTGSNHYTVTIPANTTLPIILTFNPDAGDKINTERLIAVVIHPNMSHYDISPLTTTIAKAAQQLGGYSHINMVRAAEETVHVPETNKTSTGFRGDPTKQYGGWH